MTFGYLALAFGLVPLLAVALLRPKGSAWWWLAVAFGVSFVADLASLWWGHPLISQTYPVLQAGLFALVIAPRPVAIGTIGLVAVASAVSLGLRIAEGLDFMLHAVAWGSTAILARRYLIPGALRTALLLGFGGGVVAWTGFVIDPGWFWWLALQTTRALAAGWFCVAVWQARADDTR